MEEEVPARRLVVGLGNPGDRYRHTRHNVGFRVVEELAERWRLDWRTDLCSARFAAGRPADLAAPQTYMNRSGWSVRCLVERYGYEPAALLIVFDDVALPLGTIRMRGRGRPAGHRGLESVIESLRTAEIPRLRVGVGPREGEVGGELAEYVLDEFGKDEEELVARVVARAAEAVASWIERGLGETMNEFNGEVVATGA